MTTPAAALKAMDESSVTKFHWRMVITAGTGFFTDAYDLFIIGVVTAILAPMWHLSMTQLAILNGASLAAAAFGALIFSAASDKYGRKKLYGLEVLILFFGAILSAISPSFICLLVARIIVGFGIGGDYPTSAVVASEHAGRKNRGFLVLMVFAMQALGLIVGPLLASALLAAHVPAHWTWRILLGLGAIPAASVFYLRRSLLESPRFLMTKKTPVEVSRVVSELAGHKVAKINYGYQAQKLFSGKWLKYLLGTAGAWFLLDVAFYGNGVSAVLIMDKMVPHASLLRHTLLSALIFLCFAVPGYILAAKKVDKIGRKTLQIIGFLMIGVCYAAIAFIPHITQQLILFLAIFGVSFFFVNFGPNATTFLIPSEIYPTNIRARAHGISAAVGKIGAFLGAFALPLILKAHGLSFTMGIMSVVSILGVFITFLLPEMKQVSLESTEILTEQPNGA